MPRFGSRDVCNVVIKDITNKKPAVYLETLKMNSLETGMDTVYSKGGSGSPRLIGWNGNKDVKFHNEDALLSPESFALLSGSAVKKGKKIIHKKEKFKIDNVKKITLSHDPTVDAEHIFYIAISDVSGTLPIAELTKAKTNGSPTEKEYDTDVKNGKAYTFNDKLVGKTIIVDYYYMSEKEVTSLTITSDEFPKTFTLEADTLFRTEDGVDRPCHITIPKAQLEGKFKITTKPDGEPATFNFNFECLKPNDGNEMVIYDIEMEDE